MRPWEDFKLHVRQFNWLTAFALLLVGGACGFIGVMIWRSTGILAAPDWCARAINAEKLAGSRTTSAIEGCMDLLKQQVGAVAINSHIFAGTIAVSLLVLVVVVVAKARLDLAVARGEAKINVGSDPGAAAQHVADEAQDAADEVQTGN